MKRMRRPINLPACLPLDTLHDGFDFDPTPQERAATVEAGRRANRLAKLAKLQSTWAQKELEYLRSKAAALEAVVAADRRWLAAVAQQEALRKEAMDLIEKRRQFYLGEEDRERLARLDRATKLINKDKAKQERRELERRGLVRGKRR